MIPKQDILHWWCFYLLKTLSSSSLPSSGILTSEVCLEHGVSLSSIVICWNTALYLGQVCSCLEVVLLSSSSSSYGMLLMNIFFSMLVHEKYCHHHRYHPVKHCSTFGVGVSECAILSSSSLLSSETLLHIWGWCQRVRHIVIIIAIIQWNTTPHLGLVSASAPYCHHHHYHLVKHYSTFGVGVSECAILSSSSSLSLSSIPLHMWDWCRFLHHIAVINNTIVTIVLKAWFEIFTISSYAMNCLQHVRSSGPGATVCKSRATHRALITCNLQCATWYKGTAQLLVQRDSSAVGTKGQLSCWYKGTAQLLVQRDSSAVKSDRVEIAFSFSFILLDEPLTDVCLLVGCLTSQQHASVLQGRICLDNFTCCHTEIEVADPTF